MMNLLAAAGLSVLLSGCGSEGEYQTAAPGVRQGALTLIFQGRLEGEIEPCG